jgi:hypothetical protein
MHIVEARPMVRRLAPDYDRVHGTEREVANPRAATRGAADALTVDLASRKGRWLEKAAHSVAEATRADWQAWAKAPKQHEP